MKQIKILLWFDVEDYVTPESDDAFLKLLLMLDDRIPAGAKMY